VANLRIVSWNIQKGIGMDFRRDLDRTVSVLRDADADVFGLQEVLEHQAELVARALDSDWAWGPARPRFGNALYVRGDVIEHRVHDLSVPRCEPRACLEALIAVRDTRLRVFVCHFGLGFREREIQAARLRDVLRSAQPDAPRVVFGDFNEWQRRGPVGRTLTREFPLAPAPLRTHPSPLPIFALDRIAWDPHLVGTVRVAGVKNASDHCMLRADLAPEPAPGLAGPPSIR
jgi:endonuclease/exonuclease/phosphatase family metal-dependent hydrolase